MVGLPLEADQPKQPLLTPDPKRSENVSKILGLETNKNFNSKVDKAKTRPWRPNCCRPRTSRFDHGEAWRIGRVGPVLLCVSLLVVFFVFLDEGRS